MKLLSLLLLPTTTISAFNLSMNYGNGNRSPLAQQYKSITSIHNSMLSAGSSGSIVGNAHNGVRMAPPPGEPEPEVSFLCVYFFICALFATL